MRNINDQDFVNSMEYQEFIADNPSRGYLNIRAYAASQAIPIVGLKIIVSKNIENNNMEINNNIEINNNLGNDVETNNNYKEKDNKIGDNDTNITVLYKIYKFGFILSILLSLSLLIIKKSGVYNPTFFNTFSSIL